MDNKTSNKASATLAIAAILPFILYLSNAPSCDDSQSVSVAPITAEFDTPLVQVAAPVEEVERDTRTASISYATKYVPTVTSVPVSTYGMTDEECKAYLINRESHGDPYAENGKYKGIGQLSENKYEGYIGKSWEEVKGDYAAQEQAMEAYVMDRYGSWQAASEHSSAVGWY
jgi:hypothetical protein